MIPIDLSKPQTLDPDPKAIPQINFTANLRSFEEVKETVSEFSQGTVKVL